MIDITRITQNLETSEGKWEAYLSGLAETTRRNYESGIGVWFSHVPRDWFEGELEGIEKQNDPYRTQRNMVDGFLKQVWSMFEDEFQRKRREADEVPYSDGYLESLKSSVNAYISALGYPDFYRVPRHSYDAEGAMFIEKDEMGLMFEQSKTVRQKAIICTMKDSGLRRSDVVRLRVEDVLKNIVRDSQGREFSFHRLRGGAKKTRSSVYVCLGYDALTWIKAYIGNRGKGWLFLTEKDSFTGQDSMRGSQLSPSALGTSIRTITRQMDQLEGVSPHSYRKHWFNNMTRNISETGEVGMIKDMAKLCIGKSIKKSDAVYMNYEKDIPKEYMRLYDTRLALGHDPAQITLQQQINDLQDALNVYQENIKIKDELLGSARSRVGFFEVLWEAEKERAYKIDLEKRKNEGSDWDSFLSENPGVRKMLETLRKTEEP